MILYKLGETCKTLIIKAALSGTQIIIECFFFILNYEAILFNTVWGSLYQAESPIWIPPIFHFPFFSQPLILHGVFSVSHVSFWNEYETIRMYHQPNWCQKESPITSTHNWLGTFCTNKWLTRVTKQATIWCIAKMTYCKECWCWWKNKDTWKMTQRKLNIDLKQNIKFCCCLHCPLN